MIWWQGTDSHACCSTIACPGFELSSYHLFGVARTFIQHHAKHQPPSSEDTCSSSSSQPASQPTGQPLPYSPVFEQRLNRSYTYIVWQSGKGSNPARDDSVRSGVYTLWSQILIYPRKKYSPVYTLCVCVFPHAIQRSKFYFASKDLNIYWNGGADSGRVHITT